MTIALFSAHLPGSDGEGEEIAVFFQSMGQREAVIDDDVLGGERCFGEMEAVITRINADLIMASGNLHHTLMYKYFAMFHKKSPMKNDAGHR